MALTEKLSAIGDAIREKTGGTELLKLDEMPAAIEGISGGASGYVPTDEDLTLTGDCNYKFAEGSFDWVIENYGNRITSVDISNAEYMFNNSLAKNVPFDINMNDTIVNNNITGLFYYSSVESITGKMSGKVGNTNNIFYNCTKLKTISKDFFDFVDLANFKNHRESAFKDCHNLRAIPSLDFLYTANPQSSTYYDFYNNAFDNCYSLDKINDLPVYITENSPPNSAFSMTFNDNYRLSSLTFSKGKKALWGGQMIQLGIYVGYCQYDRLDRSIFTSSKRVTNDATYQALKNDPDWWTMEVAYSRYNHDSAVETINSLPDTSEYFSQGGSGSNVICFKGTSGRKTDGGAINTLTEEEIAVATAKGWTISLI